MPSVALIEEDYDQAVCSTGFHVVRPQLLNPETLMVLLKSPVGQLQLKKECSGTILPAINREALNQIVLPVVEEEVQCRIQKKVAESSSLRQQSKHLLELAKRAVEIAIEQDEQSAMASLARLGGSLREAKMPRKKKATRPSLPDPSHPA